MRSLDKSNIQKSRFVVPIESIRFEMTKCFLEVVWDCCSSYQNVPSSFPSKTRKHMPKGIVMQLAKGTFQLGETTWETISTSKVSRPISCKVSKAKEWNQSTKNPHQKPARLLGFLPLSHAHFYLLKTSCFLHLSWHTTFLHILYLFS